MIVALLFMSLMWWGYWLMLRHVRPPSPRTPVAAPKQPTTGHATALGLEDDPDQLWATRGAWTTLDEHQLTRLLKDAAPINRAATNPPDNTVSHVEQENMP